MSTDWDKVYYNTIFQTRLTYAIVYIQWYDVPPLSLQALFLMIFPIF